VIVLHGRGDVTPRHMQPWIDHLVAEGHDVVFPRYELDLDHEQRGRVVVHVVQGVRQGLRLLGSPRLPVEVIGYSWGGRLAFDYAAAARALHAPAPGAVMSVFPSPVAQGDQFASFRALDPKLRVELLVGDRDRDVGSIGAHTILQDLEQASFPPWQIQAHVVRSGKGFVADHLSPLGTSAAAKAAFWQPADRLIASSLPG
jgi:dienelactone hydrolase